MEPPFSATVFSKEISALVERHQWLLNRISQQKTVAEAEHDAMARATLLAEIEIADAARRRAELALELLNGETYLGNGGKQYTKPCAVCLGIFPEGAL